MECLNSLYKGLIILLTFILTVCHILMICSGIVNIIALFVFSNNFSYCDNKIFIWLLFQCILYFINVKTNNFLLIVFQLIIYVIGWIIIITFDCNEMYYVYNLIYFQQIILSIMLVSIMFVIFFTLVEINNKGFEKACKSDISLAWIAITKFRWLKNVNKIKKTFISEPVLV